MAKARKLRRARKKGQPVRLSPAQLVLPAEEAAAVPSPAAGEAAASGLKEELGYAAADLKRLGLIAAGLLVVLVVLAVVLI